MCGAPKQQTTKLQQVGRDEGGVVEGGRHDQVLVGGARERGLRHVSQATDEGVREKEMDGKGKEE